MYKRQRVLWAIGRVTLLEIIRDKILYNIIVFAALLMALGFLAARLSFLQPDRVILDFGLSAVNLCCSALAILAGASMLGREFERRTLYVALAHPISRSQFVFGKFLGLAQVILLNWALLAAAYFVILGFASFGGFTSNFSPALGWALILILAQSWVLASISILLSSFSTTSLSIIMTIGFYLVGNNISQIRLVASRVRSPVGAWMLNALSAVLPNLENFNLGTSVTYGLPVSAALLAYSVLYAGVVVTLMLVIAGLLVRGREI